MIIDSFLFFQELDLLEIRLEYLYPLVDKFIIVEARQTFKGSIKNYIFEKNLKRYSRFMDKIYYHKIEDIHFKYSELLYSLEKSNSKVKKKIGNFIKNHNYYDKDNLTFVLDTYHRECIHLALKKECEDEDIVLLSDLDEIPSFKILNKLKEDNKLKNTIVFVHHEFQYYLNNYSASNWYGTISSPYKLIKNFSLNDLRKDSSQFISIPVSGYHFTSVGNKETIINKIENWGHQEFNKNIIKNNIEENIQYGKDIFYRFKKHKNKIIDLEKNEIIDIRMKKILLSFDHLIMRKSKSSKLFTIKYLCNQIYFFTERIIKNPKKFFKKIFNFLVH